MFNKFTRIIMIIALTVFCLSIPQTESASFAASFNDTTNHWSGPVVEKSYALDLMKGYPGKIFKPEEPVSRLEAIAIIIRAMGLEDKAKNLDWKVSGIKLPGGMFWGQGHLVLAVQQGLIHKDYVHQLLYAEPITRAEVSTLVSLALKDKLKVKGDPQKLTYSDRYQISEDYKQFVADVTQNGIMQGITGTEFGPNENMKRGQMAALMVKTAQDNWFPYQGGHIIMGKISAIDTVSGIMTITKSDGTQLFRTPNPQTVYYKDSKESSLSGFNVGDRILGINNNGGYLLYLENSSASTPVTPPVTGIEQVLTGKIVDKESTGTNNLKIQDSSFKTHLYPLATAVVITSGSGSRDLSLLSNGQYISIKVQDGAIQSIHVLDSQVFEGTVTNIFPGQFIIKTHYGESKIFTVNESTLKVLKGNSNHSFSNVSTGDLVKVVSMSGEAQEITVQNVSNEAEIRSVDPFYYMVTLLFKDGTRREFEVETNATIEKDDERIRLSALEPNDEITFRIGSSGRINEIIVSEDKAEDVSGEVTNLTLGSTPRIYIDSDRYTVDDDVKVTRNKKEVDLEDIMIGAEVSLNLDSDDIVTDIEVTNDTDITVEGTIIDVDESRDRLTIEQSNKQEFTIDVDIRCLYRDSTSSNSRVSDLGDLREDWQIRITLEDGEAQTIRILDR